MTMTEKEHLEWAKKRALDLLSEGDVQQAFMSMMSDLGKHDATRGNPMIKLGIQLLEIGHLDSMIQMRKFIEGF